MKIKINCIGDSVTEGMRMEGHHTAEYGKHTYPAWLNTILTDQGYEVEINNYGHGGERIAEVAVRCGAMPCFTTEDIILLDNQEVSLGVREKENGKIFNTKLKIFSSADGKDDLFVYFTQMSHDTNPVIIDGVACEMQVKNENENVIKKLNNDGEATFIPKGSLLFTANKKNSDINIFYIGINDGANLTLEKYINILSECGKVNGGKYIILGSTHPLFEVWKDVQGQNKYEVYKRACYKAFGYHFIDMYDEFSRNGVGIALQCKMFLDKTPEELNVMREKLSKHIIPKEFIYDGVTDNDPHLSKEGYRVVAELIIHRMKLLHYI